jgi:1-acyl-sn-glycerol-3-phosphate acyltransferase
MSIFAYMEAMDRLPNETKSVQDISYNEFLYDVSAIFLEKVYFSLIRRKRFGGVRVSGSERLRELNKPYMLVPVHRSKTDPPAVTVAARKAAKVRPRYLGKNEYWPGDEKKLSVEHLGKVVSGWYFDQVGSVQIERGKDFEEETERQVGAILAGPDPLTIFAEGTRLRGNDIRYETLKQKVAVLALEHGVNIEPVGIAGTQADDPPGPIFVDFGEVVNVNQIEPRDAIRKVAREPVMLELHEKLQASQDRAVALRKEYMRNRRAKAI